MPGIKHEVSGAVVDPGDDSDKRNGLDRSHLLIITNSQTAPSLAGLSEQVIAMPHAGQAIVFELREWTVAPVRRDLDHRWLVAARDGASRRVMEQIIRVKHHSLRWQSG